MDVRSAKEYAKSHLPYAVNLPVNYTFSDQTKPFDGQLASTKVISNLLSKAGINQNTQVIVYDKGHFIDAARMLWILEAYGHDNILLLNGGYAKWALEKLPTTTEIVKTQAKEFIPIINPDRLANKFSTRLGIIDDNIEIIDARSHDEYIGKKTKGARKGHIPSARSIPWDQNFIQKNGIVVLKSKQQLQDLYQGLTKKKKIITYCNKGKQSAMTHFALRELGYDVAAYDGSWSEWSSDMNLPIETISKP